MSLAAIHLREEPDALRSARPDPCRGQPATAVPTAIANRARFRRYRVSEVRSSRKNGSCVQKRLF